MPNENILIPSDISAAQLLAFIKDKSKGNWKEDNKGNLEITIDDTTLVLNYKQKEDVSFIKSMMLTLIILNHNIDFNSITTHNIKGS